MRTVKYVFLCIGMIVGIVACSLALAYLVEPTVFTQISASLSNISSSDNSSNATDNSSTDTSNESTNKSTSTDS